MQQKTTTPLSKTTGDVRPPSRSPSMPLAHEHTDSIQRVPTKPLQQPITSPPPVQPNRGPTEKRSPLGRLSVALIVLLLFALVAAGIGYYLSIRQGQTGAPTVASPTIVGHVHFLSSEQLSENSSQGINDEIQVDLTHLAAPAAQKSYYAWLLGDKSQGDARASALGVLQVKQGAAHLFYPGDTHHTNLLEIAGRFLVTEEDAAVPPIAPSPDYSTWRYYAEFSQVPLAPSTDTNVTIPGAATKSYSYLDHLRHLLAADPTLDELELPGGLNNWLYRNMGKVLEWTSSLRENWEENQDTGFMRRQLIRTLTYLDGMSYVQRDVPPSIPLNVNERLARVGLVEVAGPDQNPPSYLDHLIFHLNGLLSAVPHPTPAFRVEVSQLIDALSNVRNWLTKVRQEDLQLLQMSDMQVRQTAAFTMLNDLIDNANHAYVGQSDPATGGMHEGVIWIHDHMQALATLDVTAYQGQGAHP